MYGLRLTTVVREWHPAEVLALLQGLTTTRSRYAAQVQGYDAGKSWDDTDYLALDARNSVEGLRATLVGALSKKKTDIFRPWKNYPGRAAADRRKTEGLMARYRRLASETGKHDAS